MKRNVFMSTWLPAVLLAFTVSSRAAVVLFNLPSPVTSASDGIKDIGNINLSGTYDFSSTAPHFSLSAQNNFMFGGPYVWMAGDNNLSLALVASGELAKIDSGITIGGLWADWTSGAYNPVLDGYSSGQWRGGATDYAGLRISSGGNYYYGWALVTYDAANLSLSVSSFAFENTPNAAISAGNTGALSVPEPSAVALCGAALLPLLALRRRK